ncbi:roadblock/LC7 domain-containing protein [Streptomyces sp. NPDC050428]|uniref:roadblock/LC7 domain-containing protein n=1 Tax=Streptomyces sp. NPDC050428 TaxID=3155757 RepID=UPI003428B2FB
MNPQVQQILTKKINNITGVRGAVVIGEDGLAMYWARFPDKTDEERAAIERRAAMASSLHSLAAQVADREASGPVKRLLVDMDGGYFIVAACSDYTALAVSTEQGANLETVGYELAQLTRELAGVLGTEGRRPDGRALM